MRPGLGVPWPNMWSSTIWATFRNLWRRLVLPKQIEKGSLTNLQQRLVKMGGRLVKHAGTTG